MTTTTTTTTTETVALASQGKVTGVIVPPPDIRVVVDKTAGFVARNGKHFEMKILNSAEGQTPKFSFMKPFDPYHAYYEMKINEFEEAAQNKEKNPDGAAPATTTTTTTSTIAPAPETTVAATNPTNPTTTTTTATTTNKDVSVGASLISPLTKFAKRAVTEPPPPHEFLLNKANGNNSSSIVFHGNDLSTMKLAAQYTAIHGRTFLAGLAQQQQRNPDYDFLKPTHMLFSVFTSLVDMYVKILQFNNNNNNNEDENIKKKKQQMVELSKDPMVALELAVRRWTWSREEEERRRVESNKSEQEKVAFATIDWHDFVVVETIEFGVNDELEENNHDVLKQPQPPTTAIPSHLRNIHNNNNNDRMDVEEEDDGEALKVVSDYNPRTRNNNNSNSNSNNVIDPLTGRVMDVSAIGEHLRVSLLDSKWRTEQQRHLQQQQAFSNNTNGNSNGNVNSMNSTLGVDSSGAAIAENLREFARRRGDIFGTTATSGTTTTTGTGVEEEEPTVERVQWDGHQASIATVQQMQRELLLRQPILPTTTTAAMTPTIGPSFPSFAPPPLPPTIPLPVVPVVPFVATTAAATTPAMFYPPPPPLPIVPLPITPTAITATTPTATTATVTPLMFPSVPLGPPPLPPMPLPTTTTTATTGFTDYAVSTLSVEASGPSAQQPSTKKSRNSNELESAEEFAARYPNGVTVTIVVANDASPQGQSWGLRGQRVAVTIPDIAATSIKTLKEMVTSAVKQSVGGNNNNSNDLLPVSRFQLKAVDNGVFLKDGNTVATHNIHNNAEIELVLKKR